jgi:glycosyltransferase involved in cell wall biosynthesis
VIAVVIPTYSRVDRLTRLLHTLEAQEDAPPFEVIVVDDASPDNTTESVERFATTSPLRIRAIRRASNGGPAAGRNDGWRATSAPVVAFIDDDCVATPWWLHSMHAALSQADLVGGCTLPNPDQIAGRGPFTRSLWTDMEDGWYPSCNIGYSVDALRRVGGFDENLRYGEDTDLAWRVRATGSRSTYAAGALAYHDVRSEGYAEHLRDLRRHIGVVSVVRRHPQLRTLLPRPHLLDPSHPLAVLAAVSIVGALVGRRPAALLLALPWLRLRLLLDPPPGRRRWWPGVIPLLLVRDLTALGYMARASLDERTVVL